ncbi:hypothetical protein [Iamia sp.]|uniref:hypothetical protein n=1 Tax=Iamia sp. TaxID=2722710 RepID=UPI002C61E8D0|nr:hypothetical protein [Iamia sp.]HXH59093.1 hypothetical protein [Iamia sp.]
MTPFVTAVDIVRVLAIMSASTTFGLAVANLIISYKVLAPTPRTWKTFWGSGGGFIWLHIVAVVIPFQGFEAWGMYEVLSRLADPATFRAPLLLALSGFISVGYVIIFRVEVARLRLRDSVIQSVEGDL